MKWKLKNMDQRWIPWGKPRLKYTLNSSSIYSSWPYSSALIPTRSRISLKALTKISVPHLYFPSRLPCLSTFDFQPARQFIAPILASWFVHSLEQLWNLAAWGHCLDLPVHTASVITSFFLIHDSTKHIRLPIIIKAHKEIHGTHGVIHTLDFFFFISPSQPDPL